MYGDDIARQIKEISDKLDDIPNVIKKEFNHGLELCGFDPSNPREIQRLVAWGLDTMEKEKLIKTRVRNTFLDALVKVFIVVVVLGFVTLYTQNVVKYAIREEKASIIKIIEKKRGNDGK